VRKINNVILTYIFDNKKNKISFLDFKKDWLLLREMLAKYKEMDATKIFYFHVKEIGKPTQITLLCGILGGL